MATPLIQRWGWAVWFWGQSHKLLYYQEVLMATHQILHLQSGAW